MFASRIALCCYQHFLELSLHSNDVNMGGERFQECKQNIASTCMRSQIIVVDYCSMRNPSVTPRECWHTFMCSFCLCLTHSLLLYRVDLYLFSYQKKVLTKVNNIQALIIIWSELYRIVSCLTAMLEQIRRCAILNRFEWRCPFVKWLSDFSLHFKYYVENKTKKPIRVLYIGSP